MKDSMLYLGLDVHKETISAVVVDGNGEERDLGIFAHRRSSIEKLLKKVGPKERIRAVYEAGPTGYHLYWLLSFLGISCQIAAPSLVPRRAGDRVKTDRRDARHLARYHRSGDLSYVWIPTESHEALRELVRAREAAKRDERRAQQRVKSLLLRHGVHRPEGLRSWTTQYKEWVKRLKFDHTSLEVTLADYIHEVDRQELRLLRIEAAIDEAVEQAPAVFQEVVQALQCLRGVRKTTAVGVAAEVGPFSRFRHPQELMGYSGTVPSEYSSGAKAKRGAITKTGNSLLRRFVVESAWSYRYRPSLRGALKKRQEGQRAEVVEIAWQAQLRLCGRYRRMSAAGKPKPKVATAIARELLGFMWSIGTEVERQLAAEARAPKE
jgi:transposase